MTVTNLSQETIEMLAEGEIVAESSELVAEARRHLADKAKLEQDYLTDLSSRPFPAD